MVTLTKALDLQSAPTKHLGDEARANYEQFIINVNDDLYEQLAECIRTASAQLAKRLEREKLTVMWQHYDDEGHVIDSVSWINAEE